MRLIVSVCLSPIAQHPSILDGPERTALPTIAPSEKNERTLCERCYSGVGSFQHLRANDDTVVMNRRVKYSHKMQYRSQI